MAYLKKDDLVIIPSASGANIQARVVDMQFRRFRRTWKDKTTGENKSRHLSSRFDQNKNLLMWENASLEILGLSRHAGVRLGKQLLGVH